MISDESIPKGVEVDSRAGRAASEHKPVVKGRGWPIACWIIWIFTWALAVLDQITGKDGNVYLAALAVMAFYHYLRKAN